MTFREGLSIYYRLTKPGIVYGNALTAIAGYLYGSRGQVDVFTLIAMVIGICLIIASACVYNNVLDRSIDATMRRTSRRSLVTGDVSVKHALIFATTLLAVGTLSLALWTSLLTLAIALGGHVAYVLLYGWAKRHTVHSTLIGTLSGSTPPVIGYVAATGSLDVTAALLFLLLVTWQMPHFYAIAVLRRDDYAAAHLPVLSVVKGLDATKRQIVLYTVLFMLTVVAMGLFGDASLLWVLLTMLLGGYWLMLVLKKVDDPVSWARRQFGWSLKVLLVMSIALSLDSFWH